jgi:hypothetical protein
MSNEDEKTKKEGNKYLFYTQHYLTTGVYHVVAVVASILNYSANYSSGVKEYLEERVLVQKTIIDEIVADANKKKYEFDEDDYVIIKMRKAPISSSVPSVVLPGPNKILEDESSSSSRGDENIHAIVDAIVNDIINNAVDIVAARNSSSSCVPCVESSLNYDNDDGMPHHKSSIITSSYYAQFV